MGRRGGTDRYWRSHVRRKNLYDWLQRADESKQALRPMDHIKSGTFKAHIVASRSLRYAACAVLARQRLLGWRSCSQHSNPRSLASRIVVAKQHSVVTPQTIRWVIDIAFSLRISGVFQKAPLPGLSMTTSPGSGYREVSTHSSLNSIFIYEPAVQSQYHVRAPLAQEACPFRLYLQ